MVREVQVLDSLDANTARPVFGVGYSVIVFEPGAEVAVASSGTTIEVQPGHGLASGDWVIADLDTTTYRRVVSVTDTTVEVSANLPVAAGQFLVNLGADTGSTGPDFLGSGATIYTDSGYTSVAVNSGVRTDITGFARYWHKGIPRWELVLGEVQEPLFLFTDTDGPAEDQVTTDGVWYAHRFATSGTGTTDDPWPGDCIEDAWTALRAAGTAGTVKMIAGVFDLGDAAIGLNLDYNDVTGTGFVLEGAGGGNEFTVANTDDGATVLRYSGIGEAIRIGNFASVTSTWLENSKLRGFKLQQMATAGTGIAILARLFRWGTFDDINCVDFAVGIALASVSDFNDLTHIRTHDCREYGVYIGRITDAAGVTLGGTGGQCNGNRLSHCDIKNSVSALGYTNWGIFITNNCVLTSIRDSEFHNFDTASYGAIRVDDATTNSSVVTVDGCYFESNRVSVYVNNPLGTGQDNSGYTVTNSYFAYIKLYGVQVNHGGGGDGTYGVTVTGNVFDIPTNASPYDVVIGVLLGPNTHQAMVHSNAFTILTVASSFTAGNIKHATLGIITQDNFIVGSSRQTGAMALDAALTVGTTLGVTGATTLTGGVGGGTPYNLGIWAPPSATPGTYKQPVTTEMYVGSVRVPMNATITGIKFLIGTAVPGAQKVIAALYNSAGTRVAISVAGGTTMTGSASVTQSLAFTGSTYAAVGPGTYFIGLMFDTATANLFATVPLGVDAGSSIVGVVTTGLTALTPPSSITPPSTYPATSVIPVASLY